jgi:signal transduction histidine kinase
MREEPGPSVAGPTPDLPRHCRDLSERSPLAMVAVEGAVHVVSYLNPAFARLAGKAAGELVGRPFAEAVPEGGGNGCLPLLDRVLSTGAYEVLAEQEHRQAPPGGGTTPAYWTYAAWAILGADDRPAGVMVQVTDSTEAAVFRRQAAAMNEALVVSSLRQHELAGAAEELNAGLREARDRLEERVAERTAELARLNAALTAEVAAHKRAEAARLELLRRLAGAEEAERHRLARELHDQMGQNLTALSLGLKSLKDAAPAPSPARARLQQMQELADLMGREVHQLALELRPTALDDLGLQTALSNYVEAWSERSGAEADFHGTGLDDERLPPAVETALYRVVQEALTNVLKHARAGRVSVILRRAGPEALAIVEDDGRGFDAEAAPGVAGRLGLLGMRERLALVGGALTVESAPGKGTAVFARVPLAAGGGADG